jgi:CDP-6-deoxy-D-xylo-4-hexulose-3-dehydrase
MITKLPLASSTWDHFEIEAMNQVIASGNFTMGERVAEFEKAFAAFFGSKYAVMSNSGSSANLLALSAIKYSSFSPRAGRDEFIVPAVSWSTTYYPVSQLGYKLRFVDIDPSTLNLNLEETKKAIGPSTAGVLAVNLLGNPAPLAELRKLCDDNGIVLLEDNCESMGAKIGDSFAGTFGVIGTFSTFFSHHISTMEGGMCLTDSEELFQVMTSLRAHGWTRELPETNHVHNKTGSKFDDLFRFVLPGYNLRPLELSGAIGVEQLKKLPEIVSSRQANAKVWLSKVHQIAGIRTQSCEEESSWFGFSLVLEGHLRGLRRDLVEFLTLHGVESRPIVAGNFTRNPVLIHLNHAPLDPLPIADEIHENGLFIGNHHYELGEQLDEVASLLQQFSDRKL